MKVSFTLGWGLIASTTASSLSDAFIGTSDKPRRLSDKPAVISPETSRLALAQRLGLSQYHTLGNVDDEALELLDQLPGIRPQLFSDKEFQPFPRVLTIVESVDDPQDLLHSLNHQLIFRVSDPPARSENKKLLHDFRDQDEHRRQGDGQSPCRLSVKTPSGRMNDFESLITAARISGDTCGFSPADPSPSTASTLNLVSSPLNTVNVDWTMVHHDTELSRAKAVDYESTLAKVKDRLSHLLMVPRIESTLVILPRSRPHTKRSSSAWGRYDILPRRQPTEEPLAAEPTEPASASPSETFGSSSPALGPVAFPSAGPLPSCFSTREHLIKATNNCSSNGIPTLRHNNTDSNKHCYSCVCQPIVISREGGIKTFRWAGAACSKKDVSESFWLLAFVTIGLLGVAGWGIGLLTSMGSEELPGVLSAGVGGPRAQK